MNHERRNARIGHSEEEAGRLRQGRGALRRGDNGKLAPGGMREGGGEANGSTGGTELRVRREGGEGVAQGVKGRLGLIVFVEGESSGAIFEEVRHPRVRVANAPRNQSCTVRGA